VHYTPPAVGRTTANEARVTPSWTPDSNVPVVFARLSGDHNPVHLDDAHARGAGFAGVIVHGMCMLGASARAAHALAPPGHSLVEIDVRFAHPVRPGEAVSFDGAGKDRDGLLKLALVPSLPDGRKIMSPATFSFASSASPRPRVDPASVEPDGRDVPGDPYRFGPAELGDYDVITRPTEVAIGEGVPPMVVLLGMTGALEKAFAGVQPEKKGTWVHLRQAATFFEPIAEAVDYRCRIQGGRTVVRNSATGALVTIPFVVERAGGTVATGSCGLLYAFEKEGA
jgi:hypothetical protein